MAGAFVLAGLAAPASFLHLNFADVVQWTPAQSLEQMDWFGMHNAMTALPNPGTWLGNVSEARAAEDLARIERGNALQLFPRMRT